MYRVVILTVAVFSLVYGESPAKCPGGGLPEMDGDVMKRCDESSTTNDCSSGSVCMDSICCPKRKVKPGVCPTLPPDTVGICLEACDDDSSCPGIGKCCSNGCGHTCQTPVYPGKPGVCPTLPPDAIGACAESCSNDTSCPGMEKCCSNGCGHSCKTPVYLRKPGMCPTLPPDTAGTCVDACYNDTSCPGMEKCCSNGCGHTCQTAVYFGKPGLCPTLPPNTVGACVEDCFNDTACSGMEKCCSNGCGHTCQTAVFPVKPGVCPTLPPDTTGTCAESCYNDTSCPGMEKCCSNGCGHTCQTPEKVNPCGKYPPLMSKNGTILFCGRGGHPCPRESNCVVGRADRFAVCCPSQNYIEKQKCANYRGGYPMRMRNGTQYDCSNGKDCPYHGRCMTDENRTYNVCCSSTAGGDDKPCNYFRGGEEKKYDNGTSLFCGRGRNRVTCPADSQCTIHPADGFAVCCPKNASKPGTCPESTGVTNATMGDTCADVCTVDTDCDGVMKCCQRECGFTCQKPVMRKPKTKCQMKQARDVMSLQPEGDVCTGVFITRCDRDGNYSRTQCQDNTGVCWCVFRNGTEIPGTRSRGRPQCNKAGGPGQCPAMVELGENDPTPSCSRGCVSDDDCRPGHRCCDTAGCGPICQPVRADPVPDLCPVDVKAMCCDFLQCVDHICPANKKAKCRINPCGGCKVEFYDEDNNKVNCTEGMTQCQIQEMRAYQRQNNATRRERIARYLAMIMQEDREDERQDKESTGSEDTVPKIEKTDKKDVVCRLPMEKGPCEAYINRYYYNHTLRSCVQFKYGGCDGNKNNFEDEMTCYNTCNMQKDIHPFCVPAPKVGDCKALIPKYFYNTTTQKCEMFNWGGCGEDLTNIFDNMESCLKKCVPDDVCQNRNCGPEYVCRPRGKSTADCVHKSTVPSTFQPYVPQCQKNGSYIPQQCSGDICWCVDNQGRPNNNTITVGEVNCTGSNTGEQVPRCPDQTRPMICGNKCHNKRCGDRTDVQCLTNPCKGCQVKFVDQDNNEVDCSANPCDMEEPRMIAQPAVGCLNGARRWYFKKSTQQCEVFKYSKNCFGKDFYFKSLLDCQNKCQGSPCGETGAVRACTNKCANMTCQYYPNAMCKVNPCNCEAHFYDPVTLDMVNCSKFITQCQKNRTKAFTVYNERAAAGIANTNITLPQCKEDGLFSSQQCNETSLMCWCVNGAGKEVKGTKVRVGSTSQDIGCKENRVTKANVQVRFNVNYRLVRGKEAAFIIVIRVALGRELSKEVRYIQLSEGSIVADMTVEGESDPTIVAAEIEDNVANGDMQVDFEGETLTADPDYVQTELVFQFQTGDNGYIPVHPDEDLDKTTVTALIISVVVLAAILIIIALVILWRKSKERNDFSSLENSKAGGHRNPLYNEAYERK